MKADKYEKLKKARYRKSLKETNDCSVMAIAITCRLSYKASHELMAKFGRKNRRGANTFSILSAAKSLEIGRASCRERGEWGGGGGCV